MTTAAVEIVNSALIKISEEPITSLDADRKAARVGKEQYPKLRDALLRRYNWGFARGRAILAPEAAAPKFGFTYKFKLPADCLRAVGQWDSTEPQQNYTSNPSPWVREGQYILSDDNPFYLFYIRRVETVSEFDPLFSEALAFRLALDLAYALTSGPAMVKIAKDGYTDAIKEARLASAFESLPEIFVASEWIDAHDYDVTQRNWRIGPVV